MMEDIVKTITFVLLVPVSLTLGLIVLGLDYILDVVDLILDWTEC